MERFLGTYAKKIGSLQEVCSLFQAFFYFLFYFISNFSWYKRNPKRRVLPDNSASTYLHKLSEEDGRTARRNSLNSLFLTWISSFERKPAHKAELLRMMPSSSSTLTAKSQGIHSRSSSRNLPDPSSTTQRPPSSLSRLNASRVECVHTTTMCQFFSSHARSRLILICQTLVSQITEIHIVKVEMTRKTTRQKAMSLENW